MLGVMAFDVRLGRLAAVGGALFPGIVAIVKRLDIADGNHLTSAEPEKLPQVVESLPSQADQAHRDTLVRTRSAAARESQRAGRKA